MSKQFILDLNTSYDVRNAVEAEEHLRAILAHLGWSSEDINQYVDECDINQEDYTLYCEGPAECPLNIQWHWQSAVRVTVVDIDEIDTVPDFTSSDVTERFITDAGEDPATVSYCNTPDKTCSWIKVERDNEVTIVVLRGSVARIKATVKADINAYDGDKVEFVN